jgi:transcriptional antiterminator NusG
MANLTNESFDSVSFSPGVAISVGIANNPWFALHIKSNFEKVAATILESKGLVVCYPSFRTRRRWSDRVKEVEKPLFPGYVFCRFDPNNRLPILTTHGVLGVVGMGGTPVAIAEDEIVSVQRMVQSGRGAAPWPFIRAGQRVVIERGPLAGTEGILVQARSQYRIVVSIDLLQRSVAAEIDIEMARLVPPSPRHQLDSTH